MGDRDSGVPDVDGAVAIQTGEHEPTEVDAAYQCSDESGLECPALAESGPLTDRPGESAARPRTEDTYQGCTGSQSPLLQIIQARLWPQKVTHRQYFTIHSNSFYYLIQET